MKQQTVKDQRKIENLDYITDDFQDFSTKLQAQLST